MKTKFFLFLITIKIGFISCGIPINVTKERIRSEPPITKEFEIAKLNVLKLSKNKRKYPIEYEKEEIFVCLIHNNLNYLGIDFTNIEDYWVFQDSIDTILEPRLKRKRNRKTKKEIHFNIKQKNIKWVKFPFNQNPIEDTLSIVFKTGDWFKISYIHSNQGKSELGIYLNILENGNTKQIFILD